MSSSGGGRMPSGGGNSEDPKGKNVSQVEQLSHGMAGLTQDSAQIDDPRVEVVNRKGKNKAGGPDDENNHVVCRSGESSNRRFRLRAGPTQPVDSRRPAEDDLIDDDDDQFLSDPSGGDSDASIKSHETRKESKCFKNFFEVMDRLSIEEINERSRQWHCPACQGGPDAIAWYRGLFRLMMHAKTIRASRVKLHRELAELLDEELCRRGTSVVPAGDVFRFSQWKGLRNEEDHEIVWPPMVIIRNTILDRDDNDNDKWIGMGNQELLNFFRAYNPTSARQSYGPFGHRGISVLIFEPSVDGYLRAEGLHLQFLKEGRGRFGWNARHRDGFFVGGMRQLYGYIATKALLEVFDEYSLGYTRLEYVMRSYHEVMNQNSQMSEQLIYLRNKSGREQRHSKALEESLATVFEKLRRTQAEVQIVRQKTQLRLEEKEVELDSQERLFKEQLNVIHEGGEAEEAEEAEEEDIEDLQQE